MSINQYKMVRAQEKLKLQQSIHELKSQKRDLIVKISQKQKELYEFNKKTMSNAQLVALRKAQNARKINIKNKI